jgi:lysyl-tRNA synthetase class 2
MSWRPTASLEALRHRATMLATIRGFFSQRDVLEVETPLLCSAGVTDPSIEPFSVRKGQSVARARFLQTSPEYCMKRLLCAYPYPIYQITHAFRDGEVGARHNPEFTLLEWYRPGFDHHQLMDEVAELVQVCLGQRVVKQHRYRELFDAVLGVDPMRASAQQLQSLAHEHVDVSSMSGDKDVWLDLLMSHVIEPYLNDGHLHFVYDYPASQAALAQVTCRDGVWVAQRFELYVQGVELANGYLELADAQEQRDRFTADLALRSARDLPQHPPDEHLLQALQAGLPPCSGVALGLDRLLMVALGVTDVRDVLSFAWESS